MPGIDVDSLPQVIAGPIVRRVSKNAVAVWIALRNAATVTLEILQPPTPPAEGPASSKMGDPVTTAQIGSNLHVALATFTFSPPGSGDPTSTYFYNLHFGGDVAEALSESSVDLTIQGVVTDSKTAFTPDILSYPTASAGFADVAGLPSFVLPQSALTDVRLVQASCRKVHAQSVDALIFLDNELAQPSTFAPPPKRVQQLFFTGDQIYADDVGDAVLVIIQDVAAKLIGDTVLVDNAQLPHLTATDTSLRPGQRQDFVVNKCAFTPDETPYQAAKSHLLFFGEYCAMYLLMWSPVLWSQSLPLAQFSDIYPTVILGSSGVKPASVKLFDSETDGITSFVASLPSIRRVLANVSSYMILDDHDVTDDFYMNRQWVNNVIASAAGLTVIRNALLAYAIFQGWGNDPDNSSSLIAPTPGASDTSPPATLLDAASNWQATSPPFSPNDTGGATNLALMASLLRIPTSVETTGDLVLQPDSGGIAWDFFHAYDNYEIVALDTRTHRSYPIHAGASAARSGLNPSGLISVPSIGTQVPATQPVWSDPNGGVTIIVAPGPWTNLSFVEEAQRESTTSETVFTNDVELLNLNAQSFDTLIARLAARDPNGGHLVVFCGDIHMAYSTSMEYWTTNFRDPLAATRVAGVTTAAIAQPISSAIKNQSSSDHLKGTLAGHYSGFRDQQLQTTRLGWLAGTTTSPFLVGSAQFPTGTTSVQWTLPIDSSNNTAVTELDSETKRYVSVNPGGVAAGAISGSPPPGPDWRLVRVLVTGTTAFPTVQKVDTGVTDLLAALWTILINFIFGYTAVTKGGQQIVGVNNLGFVSFTWGPTGKAVIQKNLWFKADYQTLYTQQKALSQSAFVSMFMTNTTQTLKLDLPGPQPTGPISLR
jgi:hypothetical protein